MELPEGYRRIALGDVGSTNTECLEAAKRGESGGLWITGERQLAGRGSRGRNWVSEKGNLYASLLLDDMPQPAVTAQLTFVVSLAIRDAVIEAGIAPSRTRLKWPNDVLINAAKVSGILLESHEIAGKRIAIAGMGINVAHHPDSTLHKATDLMAEGCETGPDLLFRILAQAMADRLAQWDKGRGFDELLGEWSSHAAGMGEPVRVALPPAGTSEPQILEGIFRGLGEDGQLLLETALGEIRKVSVADIFFRPG